MVTSKNKVNSRKFSITENPKKEGRFSLLVEVIRRAAEVTNMQLIDAAKEGNLRKVKRAYLGGASVRAKDEHGKTALMYAEEGGHTEVVTALRNLAENEA